MAYNRQYHRRYYRQNRAKFLAARAQYAKTHPRAVKNLHLRAQYGISLEDYEYLVREQNGVCAICRKPEQAKRLGKVRILSTDHDHSTLRVRGLLCAKCNSVLGYMNDDPALLRAAADYLEKHSGVH